MVTINELEESSDHEGARLDKIADSSKIDLGFDEVFDDLQERSNNHLKGSNKNDHAISMKPVAGTSQDNKLLSTQTKELRTISSHISDERKKLEDSIIAENEQEQNLILSKKDQSKLNSTLAKKQIKSNFWT